MTKDGNYFECRNLMGVVIKNMTAIVSVGFIFYVVDSLLHFNNWRSQSQTARTSSVALDGDRNCLSGGSYSV